MATAYTQAERNKLKTAFLISFFVAFIILIGYIFSKALDIAWLFPFAIIIALFQSVISYWFSDKIVLAISKAHPADPEADRMLIHLVGKLSIQSGLPSPKVYVIEDSAPNAFATGRNPKNSVICVTRGLLNKLDNLELEGVLAHEFSHIGNYDIRLQTIIVVLVGIVVLVSDWFVRVRIWGGGDDDNNSSNAVWAIIAILFAILSPIFATLIQLAISRKREFLADADGVILTHNAKALASALEKITKDPEPLEEANKATAHLYIANPLKDEEGRSRGLFSNLFNTHPNPEERIARLLEM